jgi:hypothetical protein
MRQVSVPGSVAADPGAFGIGQLRCLRVSHWIATVLHHPRASRSSAWQAGSRCRWPPRGVPSGRNRRACAPMRPRRHEPPRGRRRQIRWARVHQRLRRHLSACEKPACGLGVGRRSLNLGPAGHYPRRGIIHEPPEPVVELWKGSCLRRRGRLFDGHSAASWIVEGGPSVPFCTRPWTITRVSSSNAHECMAVAHQPQPPNSYGSQSRRCCVA